VDPELELAQLRARVAHLERLVERITDDRTSAVRRESSSPASPAAGLDRRRMLRNGLGLSAAAVAGVGMLDAVGSSAAAADGDAVTIGQTKSPTAFDSPPTRITNPSTDHFSPVLFQVDNSTDDSIPLPSDTRASLFATMAGHDTNLKSEAAILGMATFGVGVRGHSEGDVGVVGTSDFDAGVSGTGFTTGVSGTSTDGTGVEAISTSGDALVATSGTGYAVHGTSSSDDAAILGDSTNGFGVVGNSSGAGGVGVGGSGNTGILASGAEAGVSSSSTHGTAIKATSTDGTGVSATSSSGVAVIGTSSQAAGVRGVSTSAAGVVAISGSGPGVDTHSDSGNAVSATAGGSVPAVTVTNTGTGAALAASGAGGANPAIEANHTGTASGIAASSSQGVGGRFTGAAAAVRLVPQADVGSPGSGKHQRGEMLVDSKGKLWLCTKAGTPGTWKQIAFV
jgi:hypothetical protein